MKKVLTVVMMVLLCTLCIVGILLIGKEDNSPALTVIEDDIQKLNQTVQKMIVVSRRDVIIDVKVEGFVCAFGNTEPLDVEIGSSSKTSLEKASALQGTAIKRGDELINSIKAPFTCKVDMVFENDNKIYASLINYEDTFIEFRLPQENLKHIAKGDTVFFNYNGDEHKGIVSYISQFVTDGTVTVRLSYDDPECELLINSLVNVTVVIEKYENVIVIPKHLITLDSTGGAMVTVFKNDEQQPVSVKCGREVEDGIIIESGLYDGAIIVEDITAGVGMS